MAAQRFKVVLFDLGDTLIYFEGEWEEVFDRALTALLHSLQSDDLPVGEGFLKEFHARLLSYYHQRETEFIEYTTQYILKSLLEEQHIENVSATVIHRALASFHTVTQAHWLPEKDALPTLNLLKSKGYRLGLISNAADDVNTQDLIDKAQIRPYFSVILSSAGFGIRKPNPKIFHAALKRLGEEPGRSVMVGDTLGADILGAKNAGIFSIWLTRRADKPANIDHADTIKPDAEITKLTELPHLLDSLEVD